MARARNIKPSIFKNELLGVADPLLTLLFESLWCLADRDGKLEDRPLRIKAETFPYREQLDVNVYLTELERLEFICRYSVDGVGIIQVNNFLKHQNPHKTEKNSELPNKPFKSDSCTLTVIAPLNNGSRPADSLLLIPDSLIPDSIPPNPQTPSGLSAPTKKTGIALKTFIDACKAKGERPLRDYTSLWTYTKAVGISEEFIALAWAEFCRRFMPGGAQHEKRQKDWRCTFRKYVENNYFKLWAIDQHGTYFLTTLGKQAEKFQEVAA